MITIELVIGTFIGITGILIAIYSLWYAKKAYAIAKKTPVLSVLYYDAKQNKVTDKVPFSKSSLKFKENGYSQPIKLPLVVKNIGELSAKNIQLNIRYSAALVVHSKGKLITDENNPLQDRRINLMHKISSIPPKAHVFINDEIELPRFLFEGISDITKAKTKDNVPIKFKWKAKFNIIVECILLYDDALPTFAQIEIFDEDEKDNINKK